MNDNEFEQILRQLNNPNYKNKNKIVLQQRQFDELSKFEKNTLRLLGEIYNIFKSPTDHITLNQVNEVFRRISEHKTDPEKIYALALFFPEKISKVHQINPFPYPSYTFKQTQTLKITPNEKGNFIIQVVCPFPCDTTVPDTVSNLYVCTDPTLTGSNVQAYNPSAPGSTTGWVANREIKFEPTWFNSAVLIAFKLNVKYTGRSDTKSGHFGAGYSPSTTEIIKPDNQFTQFDYIYRSINGCIASLTEGVNCCYFVLYLLNISH